MTSQYRRGADFERKVKAALEAQGAVYVVRAAGSHGPADLIAFYGLRYGEVVPAVGTLPFKTFALAPHIEFVQAKRNGQMSRADQWALVELAHQCGAVPVLAYQGPRGKPVLFRVLERKDKAA